MRLIEYFIFFLLSVVASFLAAGIVRKYWSAKAKAFFTYFVPVAIFLILSFVFVVTGERVEDTVAKGLFCWAYSFEACSKPNSIEARPNRPVIPAAGTSETPEKSEGVAIETIAPKGDQPSSPPSNVASKPEKLFLSVTPDYLISLFENRIVSEGRMLTQVYLGKWMRLSGPLSPITGPTEYGTILIYFETPKHRLVQMIFSQEWADRFASLTPGQTISIECQLKEVDQLSLQLDKCELV